MANALTRPPPLPWLAPGEPFPPAEAAWGVDSDAPGLLAAGGQLDAPTLVRAYRGGIFPWFSGDQPILWWSTDPRMVLPVERFRLSDSLERELRRLLRRGELEIRMDHDFEEVMRRCAGGPRSGQSGTWITPEMQRAYSALHQQGFAHSVEAWWADELAGGLYLVNIGGMVFGESMFTQRSNASKMALAALVAFCRASGLPLIDCQQDTAHLASLGAQTIPRSAFLAAVAAQVVQPPPRWEFSADTWKTLLP